MSWTVGTIVTVLFVVVGAFAVWERRQTKQWDSAWELLETDPELAEQAFESIIARHQKRSPTSEKLQVRYTRAYFGKGLCLIKRRRFDEAEAAVQKSGGVEKLASTDKRRLCIAYLDVDPEPLPDCAVATYAYFILLPLDDRDAGTRQRVIDSISKSLEVPSAATADRIKTAIRVGRCFLAIAEDEDWAAFLHGLAYQRAGEWRASINVLAQAVDAAPKHADRHHALGHSYWKIGDGKNARKSFQRSYELAATAESAFDLALICIETQNESFTEDEGPSLVDTSPLAHARLLLAEVTKERPSLADAWLARGKAELALGSYESATASLEQAVALNPESVDAYLELARCWLNSGERIKAKESLDKAQAIEPNHWGVIQLAANIAYDDGNFADALEYFLKLPSRHFAVDPELEARLARCQLEKGDPTEAVRLLAGRNSYDLQTRLTLGRSLGRTNRWKESLRTLESGQIDAATAEYRYYFAAALAANGRYKDAENLLLELSDDKVWRHLARRQLGHIRLICGDYEQAERLYSGDASSITRATDLGRLALLKEDYRAAETHFQQAIGNCELDDSLPRFGLAVATALQGNTQVIQKFLDDQELSASSKEVLGNVAYAEGRYLDALKFYGQSIADRPHVPTWLLARLATCNLQVRRYGEALRHLVELARREPRSRSIRFNLALCRYQVGREHFKKARWDMARNEWEHSSRLLNSLQAEQAGPILKWAMEACYRSAVQFLESKKCPEPERAAKAFETGRQNAPEEPRWWFGAGLAHALNDDIEQSVSAFDGAVKLEPNRAAFRLGLGLSLQAAGSRELAQRAFHEAIGSNTGDQRKEPTSALFSLAARLAMAMSHASNHQYEQAGRALEPLFDNPLIQSSSRVGEEDIAQAMVAYFLLGGVRDEASEIAHRHLKSSRGVGRAVIGLIQAESADYEGAAQTLGEAYRHDNSPDVLSALVGCLLAAASEKVLAKDLTAAETFVEKALRYDASHEDARRLKSALSFERQMQNLDLKQVENAIQQCEELLQSHTNGSAQIVRTLGVLYHRRAIEAERMNSATHQIWTECISYWQQRILKNSRFWQDFESEYNAGKGKRESVKSADLERWRHDLGKEFAETHANFVVLCIKQRDKMGVGRHLGFIWDWSPDFDPPDDFLLSELQDMDDATANFLTSLLNNSKNKKVNDTISHRVAAHWNRKANEILPKVLEIIQGGQVMIILRRDELLRYFRQCREYLEKAHRMWPENNDIQDNYDAMKTACRNFGI